MALASRCQTVKGTIGREAGGFGTGFHERTAVGGTETCEPVIVADNSSIDRLVAAARTGDANALGELLGAVRQYLLYIAERRLPSDIGPHLAPSDLAQETAIEVQLAFGQFKGASGPEFLAWVRMILVNNVTDAVRRSRSHDRAMARVNERSWAPGRPDREHGRTPTVHARPTEASAIRRDEAQFVERVLASLSAATREVVRLRYWEGLTFPEIGRRLGRSENAVRKTWYRAIARLQEEIDLSRARDGAEGRSNS